MLWCYVPVVYGYFSWTKKRKLTRQSAREESICTGGQPPPQIPTPNSFLNRLFVLLAFFAHTLCDGCLNVWHVTGKIMVTKNWGNSRDNAPVVSVCTQCPEVLRCDGQVHRAHLGGASFAFLTHSRLQYLQLNCVSLSSYLQIVHP